MTGTQIIASVKKLKLPKGAFIVYGSGPLALAGIRESADIDLLVTKNLFDDLERGGWRRSHKAKYDNPLAFGIFEAHYKWDFSSYKPTLKHLLASATEADGIAFAALSEVRLWKQASGRPKDLIDLKLIDNYLLSNLGNSND